MNLKMKVKILIFGFIAPEVEFFLMEVLFPNKPERSIALDL